MCPCFGWMVISILHGTASDIIQPFSNIVLCAWVDKCRLSTNYISRGVPFNIYVPRNASPFDMLRFPVRFNQWFDIITTRVSALNCVCVCDEWFVCHKCICMSIEFRERRRYEYDINTFMDTYQVYRYMLWLHTVCNCWFYLYKYISWFRSTVFAWKNNVIPTDI